MDHHVCAHIVSLETVERREQRIGSLEMNENNSSAPSVVVTV